MTVASTTNRVDYTGNGSTTVFSFTFRIFSNADLVVTTADANGVETTLVLDTDYTVTGAGSYAGGSITISPALASGVALTIQRVLDITQETDLRNQGQFFAETHEDVFDRMVMIGQQLQEQIDRSAKLPVTNTTDADALTADIVLLADNLTTLDTIASAITDIQTVADDLNEATSEIEVVAGAISNVNTVGSNITNVNTVAGISSNVTTVAGISSSVATVATNSANVTTVAGISAAVSTVASNITDIQNAEENATAAAASALAAQTAETNAETAETNAETAQAAAEAARDQVLAVYDSFDDRYLGTKTSDPTVDNDGNALVAGAIYFNSSTGTMKLYTGSAWVAAYVQGVASSIGFTPAGSVAATTVQAAIEELDSEKIATSAIGSTVQAYDVDTAKTDVAQTFSAPQRGTLTSDNDLSFNQATTNNFTCTPTGTGTLTFTNHTAGQSGFVLLDNSSGYAITAAATTKINTADLTTISTAGVYLLSYFDNGTNAYVVVSRSFS